jgi:hypothetical protein
LEHLYVKYTMFQKLLYSVDKRVVCNFSLTSVARKRIGMKFCSEQVMVMYGKVRAGVMLMADVPPPPPITNNGFNGKHANYYTIQATIHKSV